MGTREEMTFLVVLYVLDSTLLAVAKTVRARRKLFVDREPLVFFFRTLTRWRKNPPTPPTPVKGPEEQDKASKTQAERESEDQLSDTKAAIMKEVGSVFQFADHFL